VARTTQYECIRKAGTQERVAAPLRGAFSLAVIVDDAADLFGVQCWTLNVEL
jgi:hypothetical protein